MKATKQYFAAVLFGTLWKVIRMFDSLDEILHCKCDVPFKWKLYTVYFPMVLFIVLCKVVPMYESLDEILKCDNSNESYWAVLLCSVVLSILYKVVQSTYNIRVCWRNSKVWPLKWKLLILLACDAGYHKCSRSFESKNSG